MTAVRREEEVSIVLVDLASSGRLLEIACGARRSIHVTAELVQGLEDRVVRILSRLHQAHPRHATILRSSCLRSLPDIGNDTLVEAIIDRLKERQGNGG